MFRAYMSRKTLILREDQFKEICGANTAYLDNSSDYKEDGTTTTKAAGAVSDSGGEKEYSEPVTGKDMAHEMAPETLFALLFRNGGHGLWGHWGSGLRARELTEEYDGASNDYADPAEMLYNKALSYLRKTEYGDEENLGEIIEQVIEDVEKNPSFSGIGFKDELVAVIRETMKRIDYYYYKDVYEEEPIVAESKKKLQESNSELEGRSWNGNSYTNLTTKKTELKKELDMLVKQNAPKVQIRKVKSALAGVCAILDRETGAIKGRKTARKNLGFENQFQKPGGTKNSGNGKAHTKKIKDPNVGTGYITYNE